MSPKDRKSNSQILLVEDCEDDFETTIRAFSKANFRNQIIHVSSGEEALDYLHSIGAYSYVKERPVLILLDLNMPGLGGLKTLQRIKSDDALRPIPVVILTTSNDIRDVEGCYEYGASTYIQKPVDFDGLIQAIKSLKEYWFEIAILPKCSSDD
jgi:two-component system response regulator